MAGMTRVLVVDDSPPARSEIAGILAGDGHAPVEASTGAEACALAGREGFDVVTLDVDMPGLSGFETLRILKTRHPGLPVVMVSGIRSLDQAMDAIRLGAADFITKPFEPGDLVHRVRRALTQGALERENSRLVGELVALNGSLERLVGERTAELELAHVQLREQHAKLEAAYASLQDADDLKTKFVTLTSHELRTPLTIIAGLVDSLGEDRIDPSRRARVLEAVDRGVERLVSLVDRITDVARLRAESVRYRRRPVALREVVASVAAELAPLLERRRLALAVDLPAALPEVEVDPDRIAQVLDNVLLNAIRFTPDGGKIRVEAEAVEAPGPQVVVRVRDSGIGIPGSELERIFEAFYEVAPPEHRHSGIAEFRSAGLGLGLYIARRIVEGHGGRIRAESGRDRGEPGATITFSLPVVGAPPPAGRLTRTGPRTGGIP